MKDELLAFRASHTSDCLDEEMSRKDVGDFRRVGKGSYLLLAENGKGTNACSHRPAH
jgi:hypothetical protein